VPLSEHLSVETREWTAQAKAEVAYQLGLSLVSLWSL